jgi:hypothetical protein
MECLCPYIDGTIHLAGTVNRQLKNKIKEYSMQFSNNRAAVKHFPSNSGLSSNSLRQTLKIAVIVREQSADEKHRFEAATDALLMELVRRQLGRWEK